MVLDVGDGLLVDDASTTDSSTDSDTTSASSDVNAGGGVGEAKRLFVMKQHSGARKLLRKAARQRRQQQNVKRPQGVTLESSNNVDRPNGGALASPTSNLNTSPPSNTAAGTARQAGLQKGAAAARFGSIRGHGAMTSLADVSPSQAATQAAVPVPHALPGHSEAAVSGKRGRRKDRPSFPSRPPYVSPANMRQIIAAAREHIYTVARARRTQQHPAHVTYAMPSAEGAASRRGSAAGLARAASLRRVTSMTSMLQEAESQQQQAQAPSTIQWPALETLTDVRNFLGSTTFLDTLVSKLALPFYGGAAFVEQSQPPRKVPPVQNGATGELRRVGSRAAVTVVSIL